MLWHPAAAGKKTATHSQFDQLGSKYEWLGETPVISRSLAASSAAAAANAAGKARAVSAIEHWSLLRYAADVEPQTAATELASLATVSAAQPNYLRRFAANPSDPLLAEQQNLTAIAWAEPAAADSGVIVAVIDSGIDLWHPEFFGQLWRNRLEDEGLEGVDDDGNGYVDDVVGWDFTHAPGLPGRGDYLIRDADPGDESGHGSHVAGIIAAATDNNVGIAGVAPRARLMVLRAGFNVSGAGFLEDDDIAAAMVYAVDNGAHILNLSFGDPNFSPLLRDVVAYADAAGCVVVAAAGNEGDDAVFYPARLDATIAVAAVDNFGRVMTFSNWGYSIDIAAPASGIQSVAPGGGYTQRSGTSMAAAHVSAIAARTLARQPHLTNVQIGAALANTAVDLSSAGWDPHSGAGMVQVSAETVRHPTSVAVRSPASEFAVDASMEDASVDIAAVVSTPDGGGYELSWRPRSEPQGGAHLLSAETGPGETFVAEVWSPSGILPGSYLIELTATGAGRSHTQRRLVRVRDGAVVAADLTAIRALNGPSWSDLLQWTTPVPAPSIVELRVADTGSLIARIPLAGPRTEHRLELPADVLPGRYRALVFADTAVAKEAQAQILDVLIEERGIAHWPLREKVRLPEGYVLPAVSDFDGDGLPELSAMSYSGPGYNPTFFYEIGDAAVSPVHTSSRAFIPWSTHDVDADGLAEVMAVDGERVRLLEALARGAFPSEVIAEFDQLWGGEVADSDGDGLFEMFLRSRRAELFRVFENRGDNLFSEVGVLPNPTSGPNGLGQRQLAGDFDGDGRGDLLSGDEDGDLFVYESVADDAWRTVWISSQSAKDSRVVGGGADLDGDGRIEFVVADLDENEFDPSATRWTVTIYQADGDNDYRPEWSTEVMGGAAGGNGIAAGDMNGDGVPEIAVGLAPNLYLLRAVESDRYEPVWHASVDRPNRPLIADVDADGSAELAVNTGAAIAVLSLPEVAPGDPRDAPVGLNGYASGPTTIQLQWAAVTGAGGYRLYRGEGNGDLRLLAENLAETRFADSVAAGNSYRYAVAALDSFLGAAGYTSEAIVVRAEAGPRILAVEKVSPGQLSVLFDVPMADEVSEPHRYEIDGLSVATEGLVANSAAVDRGGHRVLLSFDHLPESGEFALVTRGLRNRRGTPMGSVGSSYRFELKPALPASRLVDAESLSPTRISLTFSDDVTLEGDSLDATSYFTIDGGALRVQEVARAGPRRLELVLAETTPLRAHGRRYELVVKPLTDGDGRILSGRIFVQLSASSLADFVVFPNPFDPVRSELTVGGLPLGSSVHIASILGSEIWSSTEEDGDGGVHWDGANQSGKPVAAGIFIVRVQHEGELRVGKLAVVRR